MSPVWWGITDIIPLAERCEGWEVSIHGSEGLIYEERDGWTLMINVIPDATLEEEVWVSIATLLLAAHGELACGLCHFQQKWWLNRRYRHVHESIAEKNVITQLSHSVTQQHSLAGFIAKCASFMKRNASTPHSLVLSVLK